MKLKILLINLEARNADIPDIKERLKIIFVEAFKLYQKENNMNESKNYLIQKIFEILNNYLKIEDNNINKTFLKNLIIELYDDIDLNEFEDYLNAILDNYIDFNKLKEVDEYKIVNYIVRFMKENITPYKIKNLIEKYKENSIIKYDDFSKFLFEAKIFMENIANEYLLYNMKKEVLNNQNNLMEEFDIKVFLDFYEKEEKELKKI